MRPFRQTYKLFYGPGDEAYPSRRMMARCEGTEVRKALGFAEDATNVRVRWEMPKIRYIYSFVSKPQGRACHKRKTMEDQVARRAQPLELERGYAKIPCRNSFCHSRDGCPCSSVLPGPFIQAGFPTSLVKLFSTRPDANGAEACLVASVRIPPRQALFRPLGADCGTREFCHLFFPAAKELWECKRGRTTSSAMTSGAGTPARTSSGGGGARS